MENLLDMMPAPSMEVSDYNYFLPVRVRYSEIEARNAVYYGSYFDFFEAGRQEYWHRLGIKLGELKRKGFIISVAETSCRYVKPAYYDDMLDIYVRTSCVRTRSFDIDYLVVRRTDEAIIATARTSFVLISIEDQKPCPIPEWIAAAVEQFEAKKH